MAYKVERDWITEAGLRAVIVVIAQYRHPTLRSHRCGYVGIPKEHVLHGVAYSEQAPCTEQDTAQKALLGKKSVLMALCATVRSDGDGLIRRAPEIIFDVHGGLTYSRGASYPVESNGLFWYGFDCLHASDGQIDRSPDSFLHEGVVRSLEYVSFECERLAEQLVAFDARVKKAQA